MNIKQSKGISLITLIITIIVIIIIAAITLRVSSDIPDEAHYTKYMQDMKNVQTGIENRKILNSRKGTSEEKLTAGFNKVYLEDAPEGFESFGNADEEIRGYLVDFEQIDYEGKKYGTAFKNYESGDTLTFGEDEYDVYVFDANWTVYYLKGLEYNGSMNYTFK